MLPRDFLRRLLFVAITLGLPALSGCGGRETSPLSPARDAAGSAGSHPGTPVSVADTTDGPGTGYTTAPYVHGQLVAEVSPGWTPDIIDRLWGTDTMDRMDGSPFALLHMPEDMDYQTLADDLVAKGACVTCSRNYYLQAPEAKQASIAFYEGDLTSDDFADQGAFARVHADVAHQRATGAGVTVAIVDTGIDRTHPDLSAWVRSDGWDFVDEDSDPLDTTYGRDRDHDGLYDEAAGHGTHVAGIVHGIAPEARLLPVRVLDSEGYGTIFNLARGIAYADEKGAEVINLSLGMEGTSPIVEWVIDRAVADNRVLTASAGNDGEFTNLHFPSSLPEVMGVAALDASDMKADFSNFGNTVGISAPGVGIISTYLYHGYAVWSGTSMATPFVSGAAALAYQLNPGASAGMVRDEVEAAVDPLMTAGEAWDGLLGTGRVDLLPLVIEGAAAP